MRTKDVFVIFLLLIMLSACSRPQKFTREAWSYSDGLNFPSRDNILQDLLASHPLKGLNHYQLQQLLGTPQQSDNSKFIYIYEIENTAYTYNPKKKPVHIKNLLVYLSKDSIVTNTRVFEQTKKVK